jgi:adenine deaminase
MVVILKQLLSMTMKGACALNHSKDRDDEKRKEKLKRRISVAAKREKADIVIKNGRTIDVFNQEIISGDIAIADGVFVGIGQYEGHQIIDAKNRFVTPSFIDSHVHIESAMVTPSEFAKVVLPHGVTTIIADPHEIANVAGADGIQFMLDSSENLPMDVYIMLPSSVPATSFEHAGAILNAEDLEPLFTHKRVLGLGEVMDYPAILHADDSMLDKLVMTNHYSNHIDGHAAGLGGDGINVYMTAGIRTDHEAVSLSEARDRLQRGMYLIIREGSVAKDLDALIGIVTPQNARRCLFGTDDKHLDDLIEEGSIDHHVRRAIQKGIDPILAIQMASFNAAECYGLKKGAIAPGYDADFLLLNDLESVNIDQVYHSGVLVAENGKWIERGMEEIRPSTRLTDSVRNKEVIEKDLQIKLENTSMAHIIGIVPNSLITKHLVQEVDIVEGCFMPSVKKDQLKMAVIERHHHTGHIGLGIVHGFGLQSGALATTVAHDSHNIIVTGTNDQDMLLAIQAMEQMQGGLVVVKEGEIMASLALPIAGLLTDRDSSTLLIELGSLHEALKEVGASTAFNPFLTLSFLALPVIPNLKLTDVGLFDVKRFQHIQIAKEK